MTFENCYIVLSWADGGGSHYSDEFTCNEDDLISRIRKFIDKNRDEAAEDVYVFIDNEDGTLEYKTLLRHDTINNHVDEAIDSMKKQLNAYIDEKKSKEIQQ